MTETTQVGDLNAVDRSVLEMSSAEARKFFLKSESYCNIGLPSYIDFCGILSSANDALLDKNSFDVCQKAKDCDDVNYTIVSNKDGRYAWRPFQLIHPVIYIALVDTITREDNWLMIGNRFKQLQSKYIECLSLPREAAGRKKDKAAQITFWWQQIEQKSIELALEYNYVFFADITDCYASIYTHSIAWAMHGKPFAKKNRRDNRLIGNAIDVLLQNMRYGQTNGIAQGSVLMDFVSEIVLAYADNQLEEELKSNGVVKYKILRYRDDYRCFVDNPQTGEVILKALTKVLIDLGLKLNTNKTTNSESIISSVIKPDKLKWMRSRQYSEDMQKNLLLIHEHGVEFPNAGSVTKALVDLHERIYSAESITSPLVLISVVVDIAVTSPHCFPVCAGILSKLLSVLDRDSTRLEVMEKIKNRMRQFPNTGHMEIWLQRVSYPICQNSDYQESICRIVKKESVCLWGNDWITDSNLKSSIDPALIVNHVELDGMNRIIVPREINLFFY
ncbi:RNA-directed DNA polymerase [Tuwongella immobilis]|uniref:Reverse transcriptase domain-containing protein n=1 Tax=Tuwongella immobilis TaxID=692036 RepID=A0A6C2YIZ1_9BACT|nr:RNA-directed DNA polymerase [Tuwongella immobilis]VIP01103.1 Uncharacterized protein OS=Acinetobacter venetianus RAG-1 = CIP 110063 GN=F959_02302 PE=4 SV=1: RVT_1 [Tuwongella immobilis]VTR97631.1 Uncharacterized protein OS=Acinetobacter venetianus RAG-1 = CIP 110063 GN=F959_02302 PE=4 SV=1: RVT_1 [Tuwongella immobilis]